MIKKERTKPIKLKKLEALIRRLSSTHPKRPLVQKELAKHLAGYRGEQSIDYHLSQLPKKEYIIFHDIRLENQHQYFQIDTVIASSQFLLFLEVKNIAGTLCFDGDMHQMVRVLDGKEEGFPDPLLQARRQQLHFQTWLEQHRLPSYPLEHLIIISNPSTIIKAPASYKNKLIHSANLLFKIDELEQRFKKESISKKDLQKLSSLLVKKHTPHDVNILEQFDICKSELLTGVHCPNCLTLPMKRDYGYWRCSNCMYVSKEAHIHSIYDYSLLVSSFISNQDLRFFLNISSRSIATNLLKSLSMEKTGATKGTKYKIISDF